MPETYVNLEHQQSLKDFEDRLHAASQFLNERLRELAQLIGRYGDDQVQVYRLCHCYLLTYRASLHLLDAGEQLHPQEGET
jgi:hypothetical protein